MRARKRCERHRGEQGDEELHVPRGKGSYLLLATQSGDVLLFSALNIDRRTASLGLDSLAQSA